MCESCSGMDKPQECTAERHHQTGKGRAVKPGNRTIKRKQSSPDRTKHQTFLLLFLLVVVMS